MYPAEFKLSAESIRARHARDRQSGSTGNTYSCGRGTCGGYADLCGECFADELRDLTAWAESMPLSEPGEDFCTYWRRATTGVPGSGHWCDAWVDVARTKLRVAVSA